MQAAFHALFHSVSAFCNAGITLFPHGKLPIATNPLSLGVLALLVFFGGIGFIVWFELASKFSFKKRFHLLRVMVTAGNSDKMDIKGFSSLQV